MSEFLRGLGAPAPIVFETFDDAVLRRANELSFGRHQLPTYDLARTRYLVAFGADFLGTWNSPLAHSVAYGRMRQGQTGVRPKFVQVEPRMSQTGASADEWVAVRPGTEGFLALGLAHVIIKSGLRPADAAGRAGALIEGWSGGLGAFAPDAVERETGVASARVERLAREFASYGPGLAIIGGAALAHTNGLVQALAVNALNALVGSVATPGGVSFMPQPAQTAAPARTLRDALGSAPPQVLLLDEADVLFGAPSALKAAEWLRQVPFIASFGSFVDDTSAHADLILPDHSFLESWVDSAPESGTDKAVATIAGPVMRPLYDTRSTPDVLLEVGRRLQKPLTLPWQTFEELLQQDTSVSAAPSAAGGTSASSAPSAARGTSASRSASSAATCARSASSAAGVPSAASLASAAGWAPPTFDGDAAAYPFHFMPYASAALGDGSVAHLPWLQELPDPLTTGMWCSWVELNPQAAEKLAIADGDIVEVASAHGTVRAPVVLSPGIGPDAVAMPVGQGHERFTRYASGRGANPLAILAPVSEAATGQLAWSATRVKVTKVAEADGSLILFAGATRERPFHGLGRG